MDIKTKKSSSELMAYLRILIFKVAVSRAESIHLLCGTVRAKKRFRTSVEAFSKTEKSSTRPVV